MHCNALIWFTTVLPQQDLSRLYQSLMFPSLERNQTWVTVKWRVSSMGESLHGNLKTWGSGVRNIQAYNQIPVDLPKIELPK